MQRLLKEWGFSYWLDSGSLLGLIRDGGEIAWDSDIDLGIWEQDVPRVLSALPELHSRGYKVSSRKYLGRIYGFTIKDKAEQRFRPIHIHVYFREGDIAWSPQTVTFKPVNRAHSHRGFASWPSVRRMLIGVQQGASTHREGSGIQKVWRKGVCLPVWAMVVMTRRRLDRTWWDRLWPLSSMHTVYTWIVPARFFDRLEARPHGAGVIPIPAETEAYLAARYGDWRTPVEDWCYWTDDGCLVQERPEEALRCCGAADGR
ncbi:LicD family protein [Methylonatrum kenyense]|uniref:LicD family protein n=1 Tax=Methylonatrum kenyense TaxID=455253 RepID=UPI0020BE00F7|nr:LicD family protein [Methylonatrum kenyense]MCK8516972.1 LicD family protein [Methylonatrum kenyense]